MAGELTVVFGALREDVLELSPRQPTALPPQGGVRAASPSSSTGTLAAQGEEVADTERAGRTGLGTLRAERRRVVPGRRPLHQL